MSGRRPSVEFGDGCRPPIGGDVLDLDRRAEGPRRLEPVAQGINRNDAGCARPPGQSDQQHADRSAADHRDGRTLADVAEVRGVDGDRKWLDQGRLRLTEALVNRVEAVLRPRHPLPQGAVGRAMAGEPNGLAEVRPVPETERTGAARVRGVDGHEPARQPPVLDAGHELMAEHQRPLQHRVADAAVHHPVPVRPAQADRAHPEQRLARAGIGDRFLMEPESSIGMQPECQHPTPPSELRFVQPSRDPDPHGARHDWPSRSMGSPGPRPHCARRLG